MYKLLGRVSIMVEIAKAGQPTLGWERRGAQGLIVLLGYSIERYNLLIQMCPQSRGYQ